ncbi:glycosyltransferase 87 family protein [Salinibacterium sp. GXW1014]|uniref:glycosyltransferase 87 family protein n=1 Tax=Salinibacterium sp. GXW1014 TaxID=3377838 RepID=UPI00383B5A97
MRQRVGASRTWLWCAFLAANVWIGWLAYTGPGHPIGDVYLYAWWVELGLEGGPWVGIDTSWVYPVLALLPMTVAAVGGSHYALVWLALMVLLNCLALAFVTGWRGRARGLAAGWWWTAYLVAVGPIALGRIDSVTVPLVVIAAVLFARRPVVAGALLAAATWMKVWPAAIIGAALIALRERFHILLGVLATSAIVMITAVVLGGGAPLFSFITTQTGRGLQIEAPASAPWLLLGALGDEASGLYYDEEILTYQVFGPHVEVVAAIMTPLLALVAAAIVGLALWLLGRGVRPEALLPPFVLALVTAMIAVNKVGSPQFITWLSAAVIIGLVAKPNGAAAFRMPAVLVLVIALLTQIVYPVLYGYLLALEPAMLTVLTLRNLLLFVLLGWAVRAMLRTPRARRR